METIIVEITLGCTGEVLEFMLPAHIPVASLTEDMALLIEQQRPGVAFDKAAVVLFDLDKQHVLNVDWTLAQNDLRDSSRLLML